MQEEKLTLEVCTHDIASCNICYAHNYDSENADMIDERVDKLYELKIGGQVMTLCGKCLDRLREKLEQRVHAEHEEPQLEGCYDEVGGYHEGGCGTDPDGEFCGECSNASCASCGVWARKRDTGGQIVLFTGTEFTARDKLGRSYRYHMIGVEVTFDGHIRLLNLDTSRLTYVEPAWFRERKIKVLQKKEQNPYFQNGAEECTYSCRDCEKRYTCERCILT